MSAVSQTRAVATTRSSRRRRRLARAVFLCAGVGLILIFVLFPLYWIIINSLKPESELARVGVSWLPSRPTLDNYVALVGRLIPFPTNVDELERQFGRVGVFPFHLYMKNSLVIAIGTTLLSLIVAVCAAYAFSRFTFRAKGFLMLVILMVYLIPHILLLVPLWIILRDAGLLESPVGVILAHSTGAIPFAIWMLTGYFNELPRELEEAAWMDGAGRLQALRHVILPLAVPGLIATCLFAFIVSWNEFLYASAILRKSDNRTLPVGLYALMSEARFYWGQINAGGVVATVPVAALFMIFQTYFVRGLTQGALKG